jgi:hypothetical protein
MVVVKANPVIFSLNFDNSTGVHSLFLNLSQTGLETVLKSFF